VVVVVAVWAWSRGPCMVTGGVRGGLGGQRVWGSGWGGERRAGLGGVTCCVQEW
jgi:hypothetical protein